MFWPWLRHLASFNISDIDALKNKCAKYLINVTQQSDEQRKCRWELLIIIIIIIAFLSRLRSWLQRRWKRFTDMSVKVVTKFTRIWLFVCVSEHWHWVRFSLHQACKRLISNFTRETSVNLCEWACDVSRWMSV